MTVVATVGTTHPLAFAGLAFAVLALAHEDVRPVCVVAGVTAQDGSRVLARRGVDAALIETQFAALHDAGVAAFHVGALVSADAVHAVAAGLDRYPGVPVVVDPVVGATGGDVLADAQTVVALRDVLIPRATLVTPNLDEASTLLAREVRDVAQMREAARAFVTAGARAALVKGGHLAGDAVDVLADRREVREFVSSRLATSLRGTGDLLASAIAAQLARGVALVDAVQHGRARVRTAIAYGVPFAGARVAALSTSENDEGPSRDGPSEST
jgi:hydroxymethylpyrimidine kinase/phosphomethylpyrimidine kinase